jgi:hypothetical protein
VTIWGTDQLAADERPFEHAFTDRHDELSAELSADERVQQLAYDLMRARLNELFGPGGSFRVTLGRATADDALFVATVADTIAWEVAAALDEHERATPRRASDELPAEEHEQLWKHVEDELLKRRKAA